MLIKKTNIDMSKKDELKTETTNDTKPVLGEVIWIPISEIKTIKPENNILIWQENLSDKECSRFQRAVWYETFIEVYPLTHRTLFKLKENGFYEGYDLEGDLCRVTHFAIVNAPI